MKDFFQKMRDHTRACSACTELFFCPQGEKLLQDEFGDSVIALPMELPNV